MSRLQFVLHGATNAREFIQQTTEDLLHFLASSFFRGTAATGRMRHSSAAIGMQRLCLLVIAPTQRNSQQSDCFRLQVSENGVVCCRNK